MKGEQRMTNDSSREVVILGFAGSLRKGCFNKALLRAAVELCPPSATIVPHVIGDLPLYDADMDGDTKPEAVTRLKTAIAAADGVLYVSPEYNYGVPACSRTRSTGLLGPVIPRSSRRNRRRS
jgi:chromate reductase, NAD(P)H dehydrogenase (quinone)